MRLKGIDKQKDRTRGRELALVLEAEFGMERGNKRIRYRRRKKREHSFSMLISSWGADWLVAKDRTPELAAEKFRVAVTLCAMSRE